MSALRRIARLVGVEATKARSGRLLWLGLAATMGVTLLAATTHEKTTAETVWSALSLATGAGLWSAEIFLLVAGSTAIAGETGQGTLKMILPHAYRRSDWIAAKAVVLAAQALLFLAGIAAVCVVYAWASGGFADVTQDDAEFGGPTRVKVIHDAAEMGGLLLSSGAAALASLVATALLGLLVSCLFDGVVPALCAGFLLFFGLRSADVVFGASREFLADVYAWFPREMLTLVEKLGRGLSEDWNAALLPRALWLSAAVAAGSLLLSLAVFTRRDLRS
jgi:hypothetical protein